MVSVSLSFCPSGISSNPTLLSRVSPIDAKPIQRQSTVFPMNRRGAPVPAAGIKRYWGTVMREAKLAEMIEKKVREAMEACDGEEGMGSDGCRVAWDEVEEVSRAKAVLRRRLADSAADPLEPFCLENPYSDECRIYED